VDGSYVYISLAFNRKDDFGFPLGIYFFALFNPIDDRLAVQGSEVSECVNS
jgi:hypothetical protein